MKKISLKLFTLVIALLVAVVLTGCAIKQGTKIEFTQLPAGVYTQEAGSIDLNSVKVRINNGEELTLTKAKEQYNVQITGNSWSTYGEYTLVVILDNAAVSFNYSVVKEIEQINYDVEWVGEGTEASPWLISSEEELKGLAAVVNKKVTVAGLEPNCAGKYFQLTTNLELAPGWEPIGSGNRDQNLNANYFAGNFDGNNKVISGLSNIGYNPVEVAATYEASGGLVQVKNGYVFGLFGIVSGATIKNVKMDKVYTEDTSLVIENQVVKFTLDSVGAIAGYICKPEKDGVVVEEAKSVVTSFINCHVLSGEIKGYDATAGIVGRSYNTLYAENCSNAADISCDREQSGKCAGITSIAGGDYSKHEIYNCSNSGTIILNDARHVGGIVGLVNAGSKLTTEIAFKESGNKNTGRLFGLDNKDGNFVEYAQSILGQCQSTKRFNFENESNWFVQSGQYVR